MKSNKVALIGLDGSGKSANIDLMKRDNDYSDYVFTWVRWKPTLLKPIYLIMGHRVQKDKNIGQGTSEGRGIEKQSEDQVKLREEYNKKVGLKKRIFKNQLIRRLWIGFATFDYFIQFYVKTFSSLISKKNMIFDRYYLDLYVDQGINFGYSPKQIANEISKHQWLFPKMNQVVYIKVKPETCYMRKDDIPNMDYLNRRYDIYEFLAEKCKWMVIDGEQPLAEVNSKIKSVIFGGN